MLIYSLDRHKYVSSSDMYDLFKVMLNETDPYVVAVLINYMEKFADHNKTFVSSIGYDVT